LDFANTAFVDFYFDPSGTKVAAVTGSEAFFFSLGKNNQFNLDMRLQEPGNIQSLAFINDYTIVTSVEFNNILTKITHQLEIVKHATAICRSQPTTEGIQNEIQAIWKSQNLPDAPQHVCADIAH